MKRIALSLILISFAAPAAACDGCSAAEKARTRSIVAQGNPDPQAVCFRVLMTNAYDSVAVEIYRGENRHVTTFPIGAAVATAGLKAVNRGELPMICLKAESLEDATKVVVIPGSQEGCVTLNERHITRLLAEKSIPSSDPACLLNPEDCKKLK